MATKNFSGVIAPVVTPFGEDGSPDSDRFIEHAEWLLEDGCTGLAPFGTTSEANSLGLDERMELLEDLVDAGVEPAKLMPGTGTCSVADSAILTQHAVELGCGGVLMLPPFYYKSPSEEGLFRYYADVIDEVGDDRLKVYLYHIPPVAQVGIPMGLISRLTKEFPGIVVGLKDSSGDWSNTEAILEAFPGFEVFPGSELFLLDGLRRGGLGVELVTTGQTGWLQGHRYGFVLDATPNDFVTGELEGAVLACAREARPDVILLDWHMPGMSAVEFLAALRASPGGKRPTVIYCTTERDSVDISRAFAAGADAYLMKPFERETIEAKFSEVLAIA